MKKCPQCQKVFEDALIYCTNDGTPLIEENLVLPSESSAIEEEEITLVHPAPITVNIPATEKPTEEFIRRIPPTEAAAAVLPIVIEKPRNTGKYLLFLIAGLILGGGLVLGTLGVVRFLNQEKSGAVNRNSARNDEKATKTPIVAGEKHETRIDAPDDEFNGRVITLNAYIRAAPDRSSDETDILPVNDRLSITRRENENSPWYFVSCEHGTNGWMHGNTIEFTR